MNENYLQNLRFSTRDEIYNCNTNDATVHAFPSSLEIYGTGERSNGFNAMEIGLGDTYFFSDHKNKFSGTSIASLWRSDLTRLSFSSKFHSNIDGYSNKDINMSFFSFSFPVLKNKTILFGLAPYTRSDIKLIEESGDIIGQSISDYRFSLVARSEYRFLEAFQIYTQHFLQRLIRIVLLV